MAKPKLKTYEISYSCFGVATVTAFSENEAIEKFEQGDADGEGPSDPDIDSVREIK
jgi:hypothetical protein